MTNPMPKGLLTKQSHNFKTYLKKPKSNVDSTPIYLCYKKSKSGKLKSDVWYYKLNPDDEIDSYLEATASEIYRYLLSPACSPKTRAIQQKPDDSAIVSKAISHYQTLFHYAKHTHYNTKDLAQRGLGSVLAASYLLQENDLNKTNIGLNAQGQFCRIDFEQNLLSLREQKHCDLIEINQQQNNNTGNFEIIHPYDLRYLASPKYYQPYNHPYQHAGLRKQLASIDEQPAFIYDKYKTFIKWLLLDDKTINNFIRMHCNVAPLNTRIKNLVFYRQQGLLYTLTQMPNIFSFLQQNRQSLLNDILKETQAYNNDFTKHTRQHWRVLQFNRQDINWRLNKLNNILLNQQFNRAKLNIKDQIRDIAHQLTVNTSSLQRNTILKHMDTAINCIHDIHWLPIQQLLATPADAHEKLVTQVRQQIQHAASIINLGNDLSYSRKLFSLLQNLVYKCTSCFNQNGPKHSELFAQHLTELARNSHQFFHSTLGQDNNIYYIHPSGAELDHEPLDKLTLTTSKPNKRANV